MTSADLPIFLGSEMGSQGASPQSTGTMRKSYSSGTLQKSGQALQPPRCQFFYGCDG